MNVISLFPTPVYKEYVEFDIDLEYLESLAYFPYADGSGLSSDNQKILLEEPFAELRNQIEQNLNYFYYEVLNCVQGNLTHVASWINLHRPGDRSPQHLHCNSCYSGVYYLNAPENGGGISFHHPELIRTYGATTIMPRSDVSNIYNAYEYLHELQKNLLLIFPSHLTHSTQVNNSNENRYCLAFNYFIEGAIGTETGKLNLRIVTE